MKKLLFLATMMLLMSFSCSREELPCDCHVQSQVEVYEISSTNEVNEHYWESVTTRDTVNNCELNNTYFIKEKHHNYGDGSYRNEITHSKIICE